MVEIGRDRWVSTILPLTVVVPPDSAGNPPLAVDLMKPTNTWGPGGPNSTKTGGSLAFTQASMTLVPSMVLVCCQFCPVGGMMMTPYLPGTRFCTLINPFSSGCMVPSPSDVNDGRAISSIETGKIGQRVSVGVPVGIAGLEVGGAQRVAEGILDDLAAGDAVAAGRLFQEQAELRPVNMTGVADRWILFLGKIGCAVDREMVVEYDDRDLGGRDRVLLHRDRDRLGCRTGDLHRCAADAVTLVRQYRNVVMAVRYVQDITGAGNIGVAFQGRTIGGTCWRVIAGVKAERKNVGVTRDTGDGVVAGVLLQQPAETVYRKTVRINNIHNQLPGLHRGCSQ